MITHYFAYIYELFNVVAYRENGQTRVLEGQILQDVVNNTKRSLVIVLFRGCARDDLYIAQEGGIQG
jgi:hypothetical protein